MNEEITKTVAENALKFTYLAREYPKKKLLELTQLMAMPGIDVNLAIWHAVDQGWVVDPAQNDKEDEFAHVGEIQPEAWDFGKDVAELQVKILIAFHTLASKETDLQWEFLSNWLMGYAPRDVMIALRVMLADGTLEKYCLTDPEDEKSVYDFYTLPENRIHLWGAKSFKIQPTEETVVSEDEEINDDAADEAPAESEE